MPKVNPPHLKLAVEHNVDIPMRDGTILRGDVYRPSEEGRYPVLIIRNPYRDAIARAIVPTMPAAEAGLALLVQNTRGRGASDGEFVPFDEGTDGADTIRWAAEQPWSTGRVAMLGISYMGATTMKAAQEAPEALKTVLTLMGPADIYDGMMYEGGAFQFGGMLFWGAMQGVLEQMQLADAGEDVTEALLALYPTMADPAAAARTLPTTEVPGLARAFPPWRQWLEHPARDGFWQDLSIREDFAKFTTPAMHIGGWFDVHLAGTLEAFTTLREQAATESARRNQRMLIGPWAHSQFGNSCGELDFTFLASSAGIDMEPKIIAFIKHFLTAPEGAEPPDTELSDHGGAPVRIFVMGDNQWRDEQEWPLARAVQTRYHLHADGLLSTDVPAADAAPSTFTHDPRDPVPTVGGPVMLPEGAANAGPRDQRRVEERADVLCFTSDVLPADLEVTGPVSVTLHAATSAADTDWCAKLVDVYPDGRAMSVVDGIIRARYREGTHEPKLLPPDTPHEFTVNLWATSQVFKAGHRLRVEIAGANFPRFDLNPGNGKLSAECTEADLVVQHQTVYHDAQRPSCITLPVIPR